MAILLTNTGTAVDLLLSKGTDFSKTIPYKENGVIVNIAGYVFSAEIRNLAGTVVATFTTTIINAPGGLFLLELSATAIGLLTTGVTYRWALRVTENGSTTELMRGNVNITEQ